VYEVADIPVVDGPADGRIATVELDDHQMPPQRLELDDGVYELEPVRRHDGAVAVPVEPRSPSTLNTDSERRTTSAARWACGDA
jgi:hypothetical protein